MSAQGQPSTAAAPHVFVTAPDERRVKRDQQQLQHVINRMLTRMGFPDKAARGVAGLHGMFNGREVGRFPILMAHKYTARQLNFQGREENCDTFMCRVLAAISDAEIKCGRKVFEIERADGATTIITTYHADYIGEAALWALTEARQSDEWKKHPAKAITDGLIDEAIAKLPEREPPTGREKSDGKSETDADVIKSIWTRVENLSAENFRRVVRAGGDPVREARLLQRKIYNLALEAEREMAERDRRAEAESRGKDPEELWASGKDMSDISEEFSTAPDTPAAGPTPPQTVGGSESQTVEVQDFTGAEFDATAKTLLVGALRWAACGVPVFPVWGVADDVCDCPLGSECESSGKHPIEKGWQTQATTEPEAICALWKKHPLANVGGLMGGAARLLGFDIDPRNGGDLSMHDLIEARGDEWTDTKQNRTGSGGFHLLFTVPQGVEFSRAKFAPGIDLKWHGGFLVLPPSAHVSGRSYETLNEGPARELDAWMVEELTRTHDAPPPKVVNFQERQARHSAGAARHFADGERNNGLRDVMCGRWTHGYARDAQELYEQMREVRDTRCAPGKDSPASDRALWLMVQRTVRKFPRGELRGEGGAA